METKKLSDIKVVANGRTDYGDIVELAESIREKGIIVPLIVAKDGTLIAGHRRYKAAKSIGLEEVPVIVHTGSALDAAHVQIIENLHRKDLSAIEEGKAFQAYIEANKCSALQLAQRINKKHTYVEKRMKLLNAVPEVKKALEEKKIEIGHALLISQLKENQQKDALKETLDRDLTVQNLSDQLRWISGLDFENMEFREDSISGQKTLLDSVGEEMRPLHQEASFHIHKAFSAEAAKYLGARRDELSKKGITVFSSRDKLLEKHPKAQQCSSWETGYAQIVKSLPNSKAYAVVVDLSHQGISKVVYRLEPKEEKKEAKKSSAASDDEEASKMLNENRREKLKRRLEEYSRTFVIEKSRELMKPGKVATCLAIHEIMESNPTNEFVDEAEGALQGKFLPEELLKHQPANLDKAIMHLAKITFSRLDEDELIVMAKATGFEWKKHFVMDEAFLNLYSKEQMFSLAKELGIKLEDGKASEMKAAFIKAWKKGDVPKALL